MTATDSPWGEDPAPGTTLADALGIPIGSRLVLDLNVSHAAGRTDGRQANPIRVAGTVTALRTGPADRAPGLILVELDDGAELIPWHAIARIRTQPRAHPAL